MMVPSLELNLKKKKQNKAIDKQKNPHKNLIKLVLQAHWDLNSKFLTLLSAFHKGSASAVQGNK